MEETPQKLHFSSLSAVRQHHFGEPRQKGASHHVYKKPGLMIPELIFKRGKRQGKSPSSETGFGSYYEDGVTRKCLITNTTLTV